MSIVILGLIAIFSAGIIVWIYAVLVDRHYRKEPSDVDKLVNRIRDSKEEK